MAPRYTPRVCQHCGADLQLRSDVPTRRLYCCDDCKRKARAIREGRRDEFLAQTVRRQAKALLTVAAELDAELRRTVAKISELQAYARGLVEKRDEAASAAEELSRTLRGGDS